MSCSLDQDLSYTESQLKLLVDIKLCIHGLYNIIIVQNDGLEWDGGIQMGELCNDSKSTDCALAT